MKLQYDSSKLLPSAFTGNQKVVFDRNAISITGRRRQSAVGKKRQSAYLLTAPNQIAYTQGNVAYTGVSVVLPGTNGSSLLFVTPIEVR